MKKHFHSRVVKNIRLTENIYDMLLDAEDIYDGVRSGMFFGLYPDNGANILPRPISVCEKTNGCIRMVYQIVGQGTELFSKLKEGATLRVLGPLGNGFKLEGGRVVLCGGGIGAAPLLQLAKELRNNDKDIHIDAFLGYRDQVFLEGDFQKYCDSVHIATDSGNAGFHGTSVRLLESSVSGCDTVYACGPKPMLKAVINWAKDSAVPAQVSIEERMACGVGACLGCAMGSKKICKDGPVFYGNEVLWHD